MDSEILLNNVAPKLPANPPPSQGSGANEKGSLQSVSQWGKFFLIRHQQPSVLSVLRSEERNLPHLNCERAEWERNLSEIDLVVSDRQM